MPKLPAKLVASQTPGMSAVQFQRQLGLSRYETAFQILHKLRAGMVRPSGGPRISLPILQNCYRVVVFGWLGIANWLHARHAQGGGQGS